MWLSLMALKRVTGNTESYIWLSNSERVQVDNSKILHSLTTKMFLAQSILSFNR